MAITHHIHGPRLYPYEIMEVVNRELSSDRFVNTCTQKYRDSVHDFLNENIYQKAIKVRKAFGMYPAEEREDHWDEETDLSIAPTRSVGYRQQQDQDQGGCILEFLNQCYIKYMRPRSSLVPLSEPSVPSLSESQVRR